MNNAERIDRFVALLAAPLVVPDPELRLLHIATADTDNGLATNILQVMTGRRSLWSVYTIAGAYHVRSVNYGGEPPLVLEFLRAHFDTFLDAGYPWSAWFLNDCRRCGADTFEGCINMQSRRKRNRRLHRERRG